MLLKRLAASAAAPLVAFALTAPASAAPKTPAPQAIVVMEDGTPAVIANALRAALLSAGFATRIAGFEQALAPNALDGASMVVLADATRLPADLHAPLYKYLSAGGDLLAFGLPAWKHPLLRVNGRWASAEDYARANVWTAPARPVLDFGVEDIGKWSRSTNDDASPTTYEIERLGEGRSALHVTMSNLTGWDTFVSPERPRPFPEGFERTVFSAKGGPDTDSLSVEWTERDGSRWIATVPLTGEWRRYELAPGDFRYWQSNPERGDRNDRFRPANAARISVGLAHSHTGSSSGRREYWFANVGTASAADAPLSDLHLSEELDGLYPTWKSFPVRDVARLDVADGSRPSTPLLKDVAFGVRSPHPRPGGSGLNKDRRMRFIPLLEARSAGGEWRGAPGAAYVHTRGKFKGGVWTVFGFALQDVRNSPAFHAFLRDTVQRLSGPLLAEGGTEWYTCFPGQMMRFGAKPAGTSPAGTTIRISVWDIPRKRTVWKRTWAADAPSITATWTPPAHLSGPWRVETELITPDGRTQDSITQTVHVWSPRAKPRFIAAADGRLLLDGKPWKAHGVNYMPSSGVARDHPDDQEEFEHWIGKSAYDTDIVARDLDNVRRMGMNSVSIFIYGGSVDSGNLLDILRLCEERGLKANVSLRPGTPLDFQWDEVRSVIETYRLKHNDVVFMYDLAWEPSWGAREERAKYDARWTEWARSKYGSLDAAEQAWAFKAERKGDILRNPTDAQTVAEGPWSAMVVDYRRFLNFLLDEAYGAARDLVRSVDPNHLVSFRMSEASNPTYNWDASLNYDFEGLKDAVDLFAPEGYGRRGEWEVVKPGWFQVAYARAVNPALPVVWTEAGENIWQPGADEAPMARQVQQARQFAAFYEMLNRSGSNGVFWWWYPGGYRSNENSDYGILNPDGTDRPATEVIRNNAVRFLRSPAPVKTDAEIRIRMDQARGLFGAYEDTKEAFWNAVAQGKSPRLVIEERLGTD